MHRFPSVCSSGRTSQKSQYGHYWCANRLVGCNSISYRAYVCQILQFPSVHIGAIQEVGGSGQVLSYGFLLLKLIKILAESVTWEEGGVNNSPFWHYIIYGQPHMHVMCSKAQNGQDRNIAHPLI